MKIEGTAAVRDKVKETTDIAEIKPPISYNSNPVATNHHIRTRFDYSRLLYVLKALAKEAGADAEFHETA